MNFLVKNYRKMTAAIAGATLALGLFLGTSASAAVDPAITSTTDQMADAALETITSILLSNISTLISIGLLIVGIFFIWRLVKKMTKG